MQSANIALKSDILSEIRVISTRLTPCRDTQNTRRRRRMYILSCKLLLLLLRFSVYLLPLLARRSLALARSLHAFIIVGGIGSGRKEEGRLRLYKDGEGRPCSTINIKHGPAQSCYYVHRDLFGPVQNINA